VKLAVVPFGTLTVVPDMTFTLGPVGGE